VFDKIIGKLVTICKTMFKKPLDRLVILVCVRSFKNHIIYLLFLNCD